MAEPLSADVVVVGSGSGGAVVARRLVDAGSRIPRGRMGRAEELAELTSWLCSERCSFSTGATYDLSGGRAVY